MWHKSQSTEILSECDTTSSKTHVILRRNFTENKQTDSDGNEITYYDFEENLIPKSMWETYKLIDSSEKDITDIQLALTEIFEMLGGA